MRHLLRALAVLAWDFFACRSEREANESAAAERMTQREWLGIPAAEVDEDGDLTFQRMCFEEWEKSL